MSDPADVLSPEELQDVLRVYRGAPDDGELLGPFECIVAHDAALRERVARLQSERDEARRLAEQQREGLPWPWAALAAGLNITKSEWISRNPFPWEAVVERGAMGDG